MKKQNIDKYFETISGSGNRNALSKTERVNETIKKCGALYSECVIIGDTDQEYNASRKLNTDCIMVGWGHQPRARIESFGCPIAETYADLKRMLFYE